MTNRRTFIQQTATTALAIAISPFDVFAGSAKPHVITVNGPILAVNMQFTLTHEHVLVDFAGADKYVPGRYDADEVFNVMLPYLREVKKKGCTTFIECTPAFLARDPRLLKRLSAASGLHIITNTGYYGAVKEKFLPAHAYTETAEQLAVRWTSEWLHGIEDTGIKPGFIKTSVDESPLSITQRKLITAAALTHLATGLTIAIHTGNGKANEEELAILTENGVSPAACIWVHAQNEPSINYHLEAARKQCWVSFDGVHAGSVKETVNYLQHMRQNSLLDRVLVSQDSGWYHVGEPGGGTVNGYTSIHELLIPALRQSGFLQQEIDLVFVQNPAEAFAVRIRKHF